VTPIWEFPCEWYRFATAKCYLRSRSQASISPWTGRRNVYGPHAQFWVIEVSMVNIDAPLSFQIEAFLERVGGSSGLIRMGSPMQPEPQWNMDIQGIDQAFADGTLWSDGTGWVEGMLPPKISVIAPEVHSAASAVLGGGLPLSTERVLRRGDIIEFRRGGIADETPSMHRVMMDAATNADGNTRVVFRPPLRKGLAAGDMAVLQRAQTVFRLSDDDQGQAGYTPPTTASLGFTLIENVL